MEQSMEKILEVKNLYKRYPILKGVFRRTVGYAEILKGLDFDVYEGEKLAVVGESGCGKSTLARMMMCLEKPSEGEIWLRGKRIDDLNHTESLPIRREVQIVFQDPGSAMNERFSVFSILKEPLDIHKIGTKAEKEQKIIEALEQVDLDASFRTRYLHQLSGGQKQRISIARSIILKPKLLLLDEPLSALDVTLQAQMVQLFEKLQAELGLTIVMVSHDLGLVRNFSDRTLVLNFGEIAELSNTADLFANPQHEYTKHLLSSIPSNAPPDKEKKRHLRREAEIARIHQP